MSAKDVPAIAPESKDTLAAFGASQTQLEPIGAAVRGLNLASPTPPPARVVQALEYIMAERGCVVFKNESTLAAKGFLQASCWWGGKELHSTHDVHPATPGGNPNLFRFSNDHHHGIKGVGPQWHNNGSFNTDTFSHAGYHMVRAPEQGGGTHFALQAAAFDALQPELKT